MPKITETYQTRKINYDKNLIDVELRKVPFIIVSENNDVIRYDWMSDRKIIEKLDVRGADLSGLNSVFYNHESYDLPVGRIDNLRIEDAKIKGDVYFDEDEKSDAIFKKVQSGSLKHGSIGYRILNSLYKKNEVEPDEILVTQFKILEFSITGIPADAGAKIGRNIKNIDLREEKIMPQTIKNELDSQNIKIEEIVRNDVLEMISLAKKYNILDKAEELIRNNKGITDLKDFICNNMSEKIPKISERNSYIGLQKNDIKKYSLVKAFRNYIDGVKGYETEISQETAKFNGITNVRGFLVPFDILTREIPNDYLNTKLANMGRDFISEEFKSDSFIDVLRNKSVIVGLGAQELVGLKGKVVIPKKTNGLEGEWIEEGHAPNISNIKTSQVTLDMKTVSATTKATRSMIMQSSLNIEQMLWNDLAQTLALKLDHAAIHGKGGLEPIGILNTDFRHSILWDNLSWSDIVSLETKISESNADLGTLAYLTSPSVRGVLKTTLKSNNVGGYLVDLDGRMNGYRLEVSNQVKTEAADSVQRIIFGDFSQLIIGLFGALDVIVDPLSESTAGNIRITSFLSADIGVRYPQAFCEGKKR